MRDSVTFTSAFYHYMATNLAIIVFSLNANNASICKLSIEDFVINDKNDIILFSFDNICDNNKDLLDYP